MACDASKTQSSLHWLGVNQNGLERGHEVELAVSPLAGMRCLGVNLFYFVILCWHVKIHQV